MLLFRFNSNQTAIINEDAAKICPELKKITKEELLYIIMVYDYYSPFWQFDEDERKEIAINKYMRGKKNPETKVSVQKAVLAYKGLQFDQDRETLQIYRAKLNSFTLELAEATDSNRVQDIVKSSAIIKKSIAELEKKVDEDEKMEEIKGGSTLSFIEKWQQNKEEYFNTWLPKINAAKADKEREEVIDD